MCAGVKFIYYQEIFIIYLRNFTSYLQFCMLIMIKKKKKKKAQCIHYIAKLTLTQLILEKKNSEVKFRKEKKRKYTNSNKSANIVLLKWTNVTQS